MFKRYKYLLSISALLLLLPWCATAQDIQFEKKVVVLVTEVDTKSKTIAFRENKKENSYHYSIMPMDGVYYKSLREKKSLFKLPLNRKYHIRVGYYTEEDYKDDKGFIYYIGTVPFPF